MSYHFGIDSISDDYYRTTRFEDVGYDKPQPHAL